MQNKCVKDVQWDCTRREGRAQGHEVAAQAWRGRAPGAASPDTRPAVMKGSKRRFMMAGTMKAAFTKSALPTTKNSYRPGNRQGTDRVPNSDVNHPKWLRILGIDHLQSRSCSKKLYSRVYMFIVRAYKIIGVLTCNVYLITF